jgi:hypothetical protein
MIQVLHAFQKQLIRGSARTYDRQRRTVRRARTQETLTS